MPQVPSFKPEGEERIPQRPEVPKEKPEERPKSPFERKSWIAKEDVMRWATRSKNGYEMLKEIWEGYSEKRDKTLNEFFQKYWGERKYLDKKGYEEIKKKLEYVEKWSPSWEEKKMVAKIKKFLEKFEKDFPV